MWKAPFAMCLCILNRHWQLAGGLKGPSTARGRSGGEGAAWPPALPGRPGRPVQGLLAAPQACLHALARCQVTNRPGLGCSQEKTKPLSLGDPLLARRGPLRPHLSEALAVLT